VLENLREYQGLLHTAAIERHDNEFDWQFLDDAIDAAMFASDEQAKSAYKTFSDVW
jgi:hypothetical protein